MKKITSFILILSFILTFTACNVEPSGISGTDSESIISSQGDVSTHGESVDTTENRLYIRVLDVGQGDCILVTSPAGKNMLIDAGDYKNKQAVLDYLEEYGVKEIEYAVFTHPHADHIGAAADIIDSYEIKNVYMPDVTHTSKTFENLLDALEKHEDINVIQAIAGESFTMDDVSLNILSPAEGSYKGLNEYSVVIMLTYNNFRILFMGDAEASNEKVLLENNNDLAVDVIKIGHHGSRTSSTDEFIKATSPKYGIISLGKDNSYGHPHEETLDTLKKHGTEVYRTDINGTIEIIVDGLEFVIGSEKDNIDNP